MRKQLFQPPQKNLRILTTSILFWLLIGIVFYTYFGYGILIWLLVKIKHLIFGEKEVEIPSELPEVTFVVAAWNEKPWMIKKIENGLAFDYPKNKINYLFVTDGSDDGTPDVINSYNFPDNVNFIVHHKPERAGKIAAVERIMEFVKTPFVIFSDANTDVNPQAIKNIIRHYSDPKVGAVSGEKRVAMSSEDAATASEGIYWKYESFLKTLDSQFYSAVGAPGELFSIRTELFKPVPSDTYVEDFFMTMSIAKEGYKIIYEPGAFASEAKSASVGEELKRKIRIGAGGLQAVWRLSPLLNIFKHGRLSFQYISHRVLRWTLAPLALPLIFILNFFLIQNPNPIYKYLFICQVVFYSFALLGWFFEKRKLKFKAFFVPFYFCMMNYAMYRGFERLVKGRQSVLWEKAKRSDEV